MDKEVIVIISFALIIVVSLLGFGAYGGLLNHKCRMEGLAQHMNSAEIAQVCK